MRALFTAVTGIRGHQTQLDVIGNNIANVNTVGFKSSRVTFQDLFSQQITASTAQRPGQQVGQGVSVAGTDMNMAAGNFQPTGRDLDVAIEGEGFFVMKVGDKQIYSRVGNFDWSADGYLVNLVTGGQVQGWKLVDGQPTGELTSIQVLKGSMSPANPTSEVSIMGNLSPLTEVPASTPDDGVYAFQTTITVYDSLGRSHAVILGFNKKDDNEWDWEVSTTDKDGKFESLETGTVEFGPDGLPTIDASDDFSFEYDPEDVDPVTVSLDFSNLRQMSAGGSGNAIVVTANDGCPAGVLESIEVDETGCVQGIYSSGVRRPLAQVALATFTSPAGLEKIGGTSFVETPASGAPSIGTPGNSGRGSLVTGNVEMSNVDLAEEFTNLIMAQRGFQANTRVVSAADEMLQELVNLRR